MIKVENLTKVYNTKDSTPVLALDNINLILPEKGMVFICGPSGSGKSTLLNILAGFDDFDEGQVIVDGNNLKDLDQSLYDSYRSLLIGFVFQDYHLINNLTVKENIEIPLIINENNSLEQISKYLDKVGLSDLGDRYPSELSGGQKQRVAIARCLVKNPKYILADEPTGNLDYDTSIQILELFKELSKDRLILIISHSLQNAYKYGDRIIELENGKIINDVEKKDDSLLIENNVIYMPIDVKLKSDELKIVNDKLKTGKYIISQENNMFKTTIENYEESYTGLSLNNKLNLKRVLSLSKTFRKSSIVPIFFSALIISILLIALLIAQMFFNFESNEFINSQSESNTDFVLYKASESDSVLAPINNKDIQYFYDNGYTGNIYKLYNFNIPIGRYDGIIDDKYNIAWSKPISYDLTKTPFIIAGKGVLECDIEYLTNIYGVDNQIDLLAGSLEDSGNCELIITDYFADCLNFYRGYSYQDIIDVDIIKMDLSRYRVKAIINTKYKTRYQELLSKAQEILEINDVNKRDDEIEKLKDTNMFIDFYNEVNAYLSVAYFIDGNFVETLKKDTEVSWITWTIEPKFYDFYGNLYLNLNGIFAYMCDDTLEAGEVKLGTNAFSLIYGSDYKDAEFPLELVITEKYLASNENQVDYENAFYVTCVNEHDMNGIHLSPEDYYEVYDILVMNYGLYFDNEQSIKSIYNNNKELTYYTYDVLFNALHDINNIIIIFKGVFKLINYFILFLIVLLLINFGRMNIKRKMYEIGVFRSLGATTKDIFIIILGQVFMMLLIVMVISIIPIIFLDGYLNNILLESFMNYSESTILENITIINFDIQIIIFNFLLILILIIACSSLLIYLLGKIKPINIIKKEE